MRAVRGARPISLAKMGGGVIPKLFLEESRIPNTHFHQKQKGAMPTAPRLSKNSSGISN
jgi:hypothetical protein